MSVLVPLRLGKHLKKPFLRYFLFLFIFALAMPVFAQTRDPIFTQDSAFALNLNSGYFSFRSNFPNIDIYNSEMSASIFSIGLEHNATNIGFEISPFTWINWKESEDDDGIEIHSFLNTKLYWNVLNLGGFLYFGPFASANYMQVRVNRINWDKLAFSVGGHFGVRMNVGGLYYNIFCIETGYRNINGRNKYFIGGKIDIIAFGAFIFLAAVNSSDSNSDSNSTSRSRN
jgi:hypothetical protein